jgi:hypothetical protein
LVAFTLKPFFGTQKTHQFHGYEQEQDEVQFRKQPDGQKENKNPEQ